MLEVSGIVSIKEAAEGLGATKLQLKAALDRVGIKYILVKRGLEIFSLASLNNYLMENEKEVERKLD